MWPFSTTLSETFCVHLTRSSNLWSFVKNRIICFLRQIWYAKRKMYENDSAFLVIFQAFSKNEELLVEKKFLSSNITPFEYSNARNKQQTAKMSTRFVFRTPFLAWPSKDKGNNPRNLQKVKNGFEDVKMFSMLTLWSWKDNWLKNVV